MFRSAFSSGFLRNPAKMLFWRNPSVTGRCYSQEFAAKMEMEERIKQGLVFSIQGIHKHTRTSKQRVESPEKKTRRFKRSIWTSTFSPFLSSSAFSVRESLESSGHRVLYEGASSCWSVSRCKQNKNLSSIWWEWDDDDDEMQIDNFRHVFGVWKEFCFFFLPLLG